MIDGIKVELKSGMLLEKNPLLDFQCPMSYNSGEIHAGEKKAIYEGLKFFSRKGFQEFRGSLHKYKNSGQHNHDEFSFAQLVRVVDDLELKFGIDGSTSAIRNLEIGFNLKVHTKTEHILRSLIMHQAKPFNVQTASNKNYYECQHAQYFVKIYDKGLQYNLGPNLLRFEIKFIKMQIPNKLGIGYFDDLKDLSKLKGLSKQLIKISEELVIGNYDFNSSLVKGKDRELLTRGHNYNWWEVQKPRSQDFEGGGNDKIYQAKIRKYNRKLIRFQELLKSVGADSIKEELKILLRTSIDSYFNEAEISLEKCPDFTGVDHQQKCPDFTGTPSLQKCPDFTEFKKIEMSGFDPLLYKVKSTKLNHRPCLVTGLDISMQKPESKFLSSTGVKYYQKNNSSLWKVLQKRLSPRWENASTEKQIEEIHHSIRNQYFNPRIKTRARIERIMAVPSLFNQRELIGEEKFRFAGL